MSESKVLAPHHRTELERSAISPSIIADRGYWTESRMDNLQNLGYSRSQARVPALVLPMFGPDGQPAGTRIKPDFPRFGKDGKLVKYDGPRGAGNVLDVPKSCLQKVLDPTYELWVTEGLKKVDALASAGQAAVGLLGVWNWKGKEKQPLDEWSLIPLNGRRIRVIFDSDGRTNSQVKKAGFALCGYLTCQGAEATLHFVKERKS